jgi:hypothetical protein
MSSPLPQPFQSAEPGAKGAFGSAHIAAPATAPAAFPVRNA